MSEEKEKTLEDVKNEKKKEKTRKVKTPKVKRAKKVKEPKPKKERAPKKERVSKKKQQDKKVPKEKRTKEKSEIPFYRGIAVKLIICFLVPVVGVFVLGMVSYQKSSSAIVNSYKESVQQTTDMMEQYISLVATSEKDEFKSYLTEQDLKKYFSGLMDHTEENSTRRDYQSVASCPSMISCTVFIFWQIPREVSIPVPVLWKRICTQITKIQHRDQKQLQLQPAGLYMDRMKSRMM